MSDETPRDEDALTHERREPRSRRDAPAPRPNETRSPSAIISDSRTEFDFINHIRRRASRRERIETPEKLSASARQRHPSSRRSSLARGIGDDAAIITQANGRETVITADLLVEEIDFRRDSMRPRLLGHKALAVSLSDIAAMGARPRWAMLSLGVPREIWDSSFVDEFYEGFFALADAYDVALIGGDVSRTPERIVVDSIVLGETLNGQAVLRRGARAGDHIFVTGTLGGAAAGLRCLERGARLGETGSARRKGREIERLLLRQLRPQPRVKWGALLGAERLATAMIDLSDGLSSDLAHLCRASRTGAVIEASRLPINSAVARVCGRRALDPLALALHGGEDFELLFTIRPRDLRRLPRAVDGVPATYIGDVTHRAGGIQILEGRRRWTLEPAGFEHF
jgi:thiamine-monophosphate kinase